MTEEHNFEAEYGEGWRVLSIDEHGEDTVMSRDFYRCPNTGEWIYKWADERVTASVSGSVGNRDLGSRALALLARFSEWFDEDCRLDHNGACQAHTLDTDCPVAQMRALLDQAGQQ